MAGHSSPVGRSNPKNQSNGESGYIPNHPGGWPVRACPPSLCLSEVINSMVNLLAHPSAIRNPVSSEQNIGRVSPTVFVGQWVVGRPQPAPEECKLTVKAEAHLSEHSLLQEDNCCAFLTQVEGIVWTLSGKPRKLFLFGCFPGRGPLPQREMWGGGPGRPPALAGGVKNYFHLKSPFILASQEIKPHLNIHRLS